MLCCITSSRNLSPVSIVPGYLCLCTHSVCTDVLVFPLAIAVAAKINIKSLIDKYFALILKQICFKGRLHLLLNLIYSLLAGLLTGYFSNSKGFCTTSLHFLSWNCHMFKSITTLRCVNHVYTPTPKRSSVIKVFGTGLIFSFLRLSKAFDHSEPPYMQNIIQNFIWWPDSCVWAKSTSQQTN